VDKYELLKNYVAVMRERADNDNELEPEVYRGYDSALSQIEMLVDAMEKADDKNKERSK